jgi:hypothetical protein
MIWVHVGQNLLRKQNLELEEAKVKHVNEIFKHVALLLADNRAVLLNTNLYARFLAIKDTKKTSVKSFDTNTLPSQKEEQKRQDEEETKGMTDAEKALYLFNKGRAVKVE